VAADGRQRTLTARQLYSVLEAKVDLDFEAQRSPQCFARECRERIEHRLRSPVEGSDSEPVETDTDGGNLGGGLTGEAVSL